MKTAIVIPARYASSRLPGKPLLMETGKYLIQHVYERACLASPAAVLVATDDQRIYQAVRGFGGKAVMTRSDHPSGTDRIAEVAMHLDVDVIVNLQGDEPLVEPASLQQLPRLLEEDAEAEMATLATPISTLTQWRDPNCVKVVRDRRGRALYFSRSPIPFVRDGLPDLSNKNHEFLQHLGLYAYRRDFLAQFAHLPVHPLEQLEKLEQLRVLGNGGAIAVGVVSQHSVGVDTPEDYRRFVDSYFRELHKAAA